MKDARIDPSSASFSADNWIRNSPIATWLDYKNRRLIKSADSREFSMGVCQGQNNASTLHPTTIQLTKPPRLNVKLDNNRPREQSAMNTELLGKGSGYTPYSRSALVAGATSWTVNRLCPPPRIDHHVSAVSAAVIGAVVGLVHPSRIDSIARLELFGRAASLIHQQLPRISMRRVDSPVDVQSQASPPGEIVVLQHGELRLTSGIGGRPRAVPRLPDRTSVCHRDPSGSPSATAFRLVSRRLATKQQQGNKWLWCFWKNGFV